MTTRQSKHFACVALVLLCCSGCYKQKKDSMLVDASTGSSLDTDAKAYVSDGKITIEVSVAIDSVPVARGSNDPSILREGKVSYEGNIIRTTDAWKAGPGWFVYRENAGNFWVYNGTNVSLLIVDRFGNSEFTSHSPENPLPEAVSQQIRQKSK